MKLLKKFPPEIERSHFEALNKRVENALSRIRGTINLKDPREKAYYLALKAIGTKRLLIGDVCLLRRIVMFFDKIIPHGNFTRHPQTNFQIRFAQITQEARKAFNFEYFCNTSDEKGKWGGWALAKELNKRLKYCPYCNAETLYAFKWKQNGRIRFAKSAFDHYFPRSRYPFLGLSLYNIIPSCTRCNSTFKSGGAHDLPMTAHPYVADMDSNMRFHALLVDPCAAAQGEAGGISGVVLAERYYGSFMPGVLWDRLFKLTESYSSLYSQDVAWVVARALRYPKSYLIEALRWLSNAGLSVSSLEAQLYGVPLDRKAINEHRFGKLVCDIVETYRK